MKYMTVKKGLRTLITAKFAIKDYTILIKKAIQASSYDTPAFRMKLEQNKK